MVVFRSCVRCRDGASGWRTGAGARRDGLARRDGCLAEARHTGRCVVSDAAGRAPVVFARSARRVKDAGCVDPVDPVGRPRLLLPCKALRSRGETASPSRQATRPSFLGKPFPKGGSTGSIGSTRSTVSASRVHPASTHGPSGIGERPRAAHQSSSSGPCVPVTALDLPDPACPECPGKRPFAECRRPDRLRPSGVRHMEVGERFFAVSPGHPVRADPLREDATRPGCGLRPRPPGTGCGANAVSQGETRLGDGTAGSGTCPVPPHRPRPTRGRIRARPDHSWEPRTHRCVRRAGCGRRTAPRAAGLDTAVGLVDEGHPGGLAVGDRPDPADRHARDAWSSRCAGSPGSRATA